VLKQIFEFGFFHTDPHPGNLLVRPDGVIVPLDFGQVARLSEDDREVLGDCVLAIVDGDASRLVRAFRRSAMFGEQTETRALSRDVEDMLASYRSLPLREIPFARVISETFDIVRKHHVRLPAEFTLMLKSMMTIESLARTLDRDFQIIPHLRPYAVQLRLGRIDPRRLLRESRSVLRDTVDLATRLPEELESLLDRTRRGQLRLHIEHEHLDDFVHTLDRSSNRISFAMIIAGLLVGSSLLVTQEGVVLGLVRFQTLGVLGYVAAAVLGLYVVISILRRRHL
jgi:ubiquinone biosynthesis protein